MEEEGERREEEEGEITGGRQELGIAEIKQIKKSRKGKAAGGDGIENEAWKYMTREMEMALIEVLEKIWREKKDSRELERRNNKSDI